jgi:hypothetical protein
MSWNESEIMKARRAIFDTVQDMLAGRLSYIEGARKIVAAGWVARLDERDPDLLHFQGIDSETEALPFGEMRAHWQPAALEALQPEIDRAEAWARQFGEPHCRNLVVRFSGDQIMPVIGPSGSLIATDNFFKKDDKDGFPSTTICARSGFGYGINHNQSEAAKRT